MRERARQGDKACEREPGRDIKPVRERAMQEIKPVRERQSRQGHKACEREREPETACEIENQPVRERARQGDKV